MKFCFIICTIICFILFFVGSYSFSTNVDNINKSSKLIPGSDEPEASSEAVSEATTSSTENEVKPESTETSTEATSETSEENKPSESGESSENSESTTPKEELSKDEASSVEDVEQDVTFGENSEKDLLTQAKEYEQSGKFSDAATKYNDFIQKETTFNYDAYTGISRCYVEMNDSVNALTFLEYADQQKANDANILILKAKAYYISGKTNDVKKCLKQLANLSIKEAKYNNDLGVLAINVKEYNYAVDRFNYANAILPNNPIILCNYGLSYIHVKKFTEAENQLTLARKLAVSSNDQEIVKNIDLNIAKLYSERGDFIKSLTLLEKLHSENPSDFQITYALGLEKYNIGLYDTSIKLLESARTMQPNNFDVCLALSSAYYFNGEYEKSLQLLREAQNSNIAKGKVENKIYEIELASRLNLKSNEVTLGRVEKDKMVGVYRGVYDPQLGNWKVEIEFKSNYIKKVSVKWQLISDGKTIYEGFTNLDSSQALQVVPSPYIKGLDNRPTDIKISNIIQYSKNTK